MKLSTRSRYGMRLLIDLSRLEGQVSSLYAVAMRQKISANYLEQVAKDLKRAGVIRSIKGPGGGYRLARSPEAINVGEVLRFLEGDIAITESPDVNESILQQCVRQQVFDGVNQKLAAYFDSITLEDVIIGQDWTDGYGKAQVNET